MAEASPASEAKTKSIPRYRVIFWNDNKTSFEFVIWAVQTYFFKSFLDAQSFAIEVHLKGSGCAGVYSLELAELKQEQTLSAAKAQNFPLILTLERE